MLSWLKLLINFYCCIWLVVYMVYILIHDPIARSSKQSDVLNCFCFNDTLKKAIRCRNLWYNKQQCSVQHNIQLIWYIYWSWATCFDSLGITIRPCLKYEDPLHKTIKTSFGIRNVHNKLLVMIHMSLLTVICIITRCLLWKFGIPKRDLIVLCNDSLFFLERAWWWFLENRNM